MEEWKNDSLLNLTRGYIFIHTPFCGTCQMARKMLHVVENMRDSHVFYDLNASLFPSFMQEHKVESVPCLLVVEQGEVKERVYAFHSVLHIANLLDSYEAQ